MNRFEYYIFVNFYYWPGTIAAGAAILNYLLYLIKDSGWLSVVKSGGKFGSALSGGVSLFYHLTLIFVAIFGFIAFFFGKEKDAISDAQQRTQTIEYEKYKKSADVKIKESSASAEAARQDAAKANERSAQLALQTAELQHENLKLQEKLAWRHLTARQADDLVSVLKKYAGHKIVLGYLVNDAESASYSSELRAVFAKAGWAVDSLATAFGGSGGTPVGVRMMLNPSDYNDRFKNETASIIYRLLQRQGIMNGDVPVRSDSTPSGTIFLIVGSKAAFR